MAKFIRRTSIGGAIATALLAAAATYAATPADIYGSAWPEGYMAERTIEVTPATKSINVNYGEAVRFVVQNAGTTQEVVWHFDGLAEKMTLGTLLGSDSASAGSSMAGPAESVPIYVHQGNNPLRTPRGAGAE